MMVDYGNFKWLNEGEMKIEEDKIVMKAPQRYLMISKIPMIPRRLWSCRIRITGRSAVLNLQISALMQLSVLLLKMVSRMMRMGAILMGRMRSG